MASKSGQDKYAGRSTPTTSQDHGRDSRHESLPVVRKPGSEPNAVGAGRGTRRPFEKGSRNVETDSSRDHHGRRTMSDSDSQYGGGRNVHGRSKHKSEQVPVGYARSKSDQPEAQRRDVHSHRYCDHRKHSDNSASASKHVIKEIHQPHQRFVTKVSKRAFRINHVSLFSKST